MADYWKQKERRDWQSKREAEGVVADSMEYRMALIKRFEAGEITFDQMQAELKATKRNAKRNGQITRGQAYRGY